MSAEREPQPIEPPEKPELMDILASMSFSRMNSTAALDDIAEPTADELAALAENNEFDDIEIPIELPDEGRARPRKMRTDTSLLPAMEACEEPELVSLEGLDEVDALDEDLLEDDDSLDELLENYADIELADDELDDEGYDLDDEDDVHYQDLYGEDGLIIPSFREGELDDDDENGIAYYNNLR